MPAGSDALDATFALLSRYPESLLKVERRAGSVVATPTGEDTYPVTIYDQGEEAMVAADRWHAHYDEPQQAAFCALWLLTPFYRIVRELKGGVLVAAWLERYEATGWEPFEPAYFLNPEDEPSWRLAPNEKYVHRIIQQNVLPSPAPYEQVCPGAVLDQVGLPPDSHFGERAEEVGEPTGPSLF